MRDVDDVASGTQNDAFTAGVTAATLGDDPGRVRVLAPMTGNEIKPSSSVALVIDDNLLLALAFGLLGVDVEQFLTDVSAVNGSLALACLLSSVATITGSFRVEDAGCQIQAAGLKHAEVQQQRLQLRRFPVVRGSQTFRSRRCRADSFGIRLPAGTRIPVDDRHLADFRPLHVVVSRHKMNHLCAQPDGKFFNHLTLVVHVAAVADQAAQPNAARLGKFPNPLQMLLAAYMAIISPEQTM